MSMMMLRHLLMKPSVSMLSSSQNLFRVSPMNYSYCFIGSQPSTNRRIVQIANIPQAEYTAHKTDAEVNYMVSFQPDWKRTICTARETIKRLFSIASYVTTSSRPWTTSKLLEAILLLRENDRFWDGNLVADAVIHVDSRRPKAEIAAHHDFVKSLVSNSIKFNWFATIILNVS